VKWCERGQRCTCWIDGWFGKSWAWACELHDERYMTPIGKGMTRLECDVELMKNVAVACKVMAIIMFIGVRCVGGYWWNHFEEARQ